MAAKFYKMNAYLLPELSGYDQVLWIDAHFFHKHQPPFNNQMREQIGSLLENHTMVIPSHIERNTVAAEVGPAIDRAVRNGLVHAGATDTRKAFEHQLNDGFKDDVGLWWCGVFAYTAKDLQLQQALNDWWKEVQIFSFRDQISFPYVVWKYGVDILTITEPEMCGVIDGVTKPGCGDMRKTSL